MKKSVSKSTTLAVLTAALGLQVFLPGCGGNTTGQVIVLEGNGVYFSLSNITGMLVDGGLTQDSRLIVRSPDKYCIENVTGSGVVRSDESKDKAVSEPVIVEGDDAITVEFVCENSDLKDIIVKKTYTLRWDSATLIKQVEFESVKDEPVFVTYSTSVNLDADFRRNTYYNALVVAHSTTIADLIPADSIEARKEANPGEQYWNAQPKIVAGVNLKTGFGVGQYRHKINGRYVFINVHKSDIPRLYYTKTGWDMGISVTRLDPGASTSSEARLEIFSGDQMSFYADYFNLPEVKELQAYDQTVPGWINTITGEDIHWWVAYDENGQGTRSMLIDLLNSELLPDDTSIPVAVWAWYDTYGDYFPKGIKYPLGREVNVDELGDKIQRIKALSPRVKIGIVSWLAYLDEASETVKEHPDSIVYDRQGIPANRWNYSSEFGADGATAAITNMTDDLKEHMLEQYRALFEKFNADYIYVDGGMLGHSMIDWRTGTVVQEYEWYDMYKRMRDLAREYGGAIHNNYPGSFWADMSYSEILDYSTSIWRIRAATMFIPMFYTPKHSTRIVYYPREQMGYYNYILGLGLSPIRTGGYAYTLNEAASEVRDMKPVADAGLEPAWWRNDQTLLEAFTLEQGTARIISFISHDELEDNVKISVDTNKFGLNNDREGFVWLFRREQIAEDKVSELFDIRPSVWKGMIEEGQVPKVLNVELLSCYEELPRTLEFDLPASKELLNMISITNVPAVVYSVEGRSTHFRLPTTLGVEIDGEIDRVGKRVKLTVVCQSEHAEIGAYWPSEWVLGSVTVDGHVVDYKRDKIGGNEFIVIELRKGESEVALWVG